MKLRIFTIATCFLLVVVACKTSKKTTTSTNTNVVTSTNTTTNTNTTTATNTNTNNNTMFVAADPFAAGDKEVEAIKTKFPDVTLATLAEGQRIYIGPCQKCHSEAKMKLYTRSEENWKHAVDVMAPKARITDVEKDALWKYILAMRATHPQN